MDLSIYDAIKCINAKKRVLKTEIIPIEDSLKRVSAQTLYGGIALPIFDNSAMDGYAIDSKDLGKRVTIKDRLLAGDAIDHQVSPGTAIEIMTGSALPKGCDTVVPFEMVDTIDAQTIQLPSAMKVGANIRHRGEDIEKNSVILSKGVMIEYSHIGLLASQGITHIQVYKRPKVTVFATGSELKLHYEQLGSNQIYNSNTPSMISYAKDMGCEVSFSGKVQDKIEDIVSLIESSKSEDLVVTSGGVSVGVADFTKDAFKACGFEAVFTKVDIRPGKPTTYGYMGDTEVLNLPGNPLAAMINFEIFGRVIIHHLLGLKDTNIGYVEVKLAKEYTHKKGRNSVMPGYIQDGEFHICTKYAPGMVSVLPASNGLAIFSKELESVPKGSYVKVIPMHWKLRDSCCADFINTSQSLG